MRDPDYYLLDPKDIPEPSSLDDVHRQLIHLRVCLEQTNEHLEKIRWGAGFIALIATVFLLDHFGALQPVKDWLGIR